MVIACTAGSWFTAWLKACTFWAKSRTSLPDRFCRLTSTPEVDPRPGISGRLKAKPTASFIPNSLPLIRLVIASIDSFLPRSSQGLSRMKMVALLVWLVRVSTSSPANATTFTTAGSSRRKPSTRWINRLGALQRGGIRQLHRDGEISLVLRRDEPGGDPFPQRDCECHHHDERRQPHPAAGRALGPPRWRSGRWYCGTSG